MGQDARTSHAIAISWHLPIRLANGLGGPDLFLNLSRVFLWGLLFAVVYWRTQNLWIAVGVHALSNKPMILFADVSYWRFAGTFWLLVLAALAFWPKLSNQTRTRSPATRNRVI